MLFKHHGILGINARNLLYIRAYNKAKAIQLADSKLATKSFLSTRGIPVPKLYRTIRNPQELKTFNFATLPDQFVLKPNRGSGGEGIFPIWGKTEEGYRLADDTVIEHREFIEHISDILDGRFSISGTSDSAFFEQLLICDKRLAKFAYKGLPDIRIVVYNLVPIMAMLRLPTRKSNGKANLHQGAIGVGLDMAQGEATHIVQGNRIIQEIPELGSIKGFKLPYWKEMLRLASQIQLETNLGYLAVDIALDDHQGPVLLELNARAGLGLQIANLAPLAKRLERVRGLKVQNPEKGLRLAKDMFGNRLEKEIKQISGKQVVGMNEPVKILVGIKPYRLMAHVDVHRQKTQIDRTLAESIGLMKEGETNETSVKLKFILSGVRIQTIAILVDLAESEHKFIVGRRDLKSFLIDVERESTQNTKIKGINLLPKKEKSVNSLFSEIDGRICDIDSQIKLLYHLRPTNLTAEKKKFLTGEIHNPQFIYPSLKFNPIELKSQLMDFKMDDSSLGQIYQKKRLEILRKVELLVHRGGDCFSQKSEELFGAPTAEELERAHRFYIQKPAIFEKEEGTLHAEEIQQRFTNYLEEKGLAHWKVILKEEMVSDCIAGKSNHLFLKANITWSEARFQMVLAHEIKTHIFTAENGSQQNYRIFARGTGDYLMTQEGLAIYNQEKAVAHINEKHFWGAQLMLLIDLAQKNSFYEIYQKARSWGHDEEKSFQFALRVKRGLSDTSAPGAFTKDLVYFRGRESILKFVERGGDIKRLYIGKIDLESLPQIEAFGSIVAPRYLP